MFDIFIAILLACSCPDPSSHGATIHPIVQPVIIGGGIRPLTAPDTTGGGDGSGGDGGHIPPGPR